MVVLSLRSPFRVVLSNGVCSCESGNHVNYLGCVSK